MNNKYTLFIFAILFILIGFGGGFFIAKKQYLVQLPQELPSLSSQKNLLIDSAIGEIVSIENGKISLKIKDNQLPIGPELLTRVVNLNGSTALYQLTFKSQEKLKEEYVQFEENVKEARKQMQDPAVIVRNNTPPTMESKVAIRATDLRVGQLVTVKTRENILEKGDLTASEISIMPIPVQAPAPVSVDIPMAN